MTSDKKYFNVRIEFDKDKLDKTIFEAIEKGIPGYSCSVESNNLTVANQNPEFLEVLNRALVNNCDGSILAKILAWIHHEPIDRYIGADIFIKYIVLCSVFVYLLIFFTFYFKLFKCMQICSSTRGYIPIFWK